MIKVIRPNSMPHILPGTILLDYKGRNFEMENRKCSRAASLTFGYGEPDNFDEFQFQIEFQEFFVVDVILDFKYGVIRQSMDGIELGMIRISRICVDDISLVISGHYLHGQLEGLENAYVVDDLIEFEAMFEIRRIKSIFVKRFVEGLGEYTCFSFLLKRFLLQPAPVQNEP